MSDFTFMRAGFDNLQDASNEEAMKKNIVSIVVKFSEGAMITAAKYVAHCNYRNVVLPEDLKRGMMLEMFLFKHRDNLLEEIEQIKEELFNSEIGGDVDLDGYDEDDEELEFTESECGCAICGAINNIYEHWKTLEIQSPYETMLKKHIENMC